MLEELSTSLVYPLPQTFTFGAVFSDLRNVFETANHAVLLSKVSTFNSFPDAKTNLKLSESIIISPLPSAPPLASHKDTYWANFYPS